MNPLNRQLSEIITARRDALAEAIVSCEIDRHPDLEQRYGPALRERARKDAGYHLSFLATAIRTETPALFADYTAWVKVLLVKRGLRIEDIAFHFECLHDVLCRSFPGEPGTLACEFVAAAQRLLPDLPEDLPSTIDESRPNGPLGRQYLETLLHGERRDARDLILDAVGGGATVGEVYRDVFQPSQHEVGRLWQTNRIGVGHEHYCTAATQLIMSQLYPHVFATEKRGRTLVATCAADDLHEIGVRMVADLFELEGWTTYYLGASTPVPSVVQMVTERKANVLAVSATIAYHLPALEALIAAVRNAPGCRDLKILVGGYPFNLDPDLWRKVGADGSARTAQDAIALADELTS